jgi:SagB-type dehydrogenase family enzyme
MKPSTNFDSTLVLTTDKTAISEDTARQIQQANRTFAPYYKPLQSISIEDARTRKSSYEFGAVGLKELGELLHLSLYSSERPDARPYPAAGGIYSVNLYLAAMSVDGLPSGIHFVRWQDQVLEQIGSDSAARELYDQTYHPNMNDVPLIAVLVADLRLSTYKYRDAAMRMAYIEAGALLQTLYLAANKLNLPICALGGISDRAALKITKMEPSADIIFNCGVAIGGRPTNI